MAPSLRTFLTGGDRRSQAKAKRALVRVLNDRRLVSELVTLTGDDDWLVSMRAMDLLEKLAHQHPEWIEAHKRVFIGPLAVSDKWEIRLQIVRALPLFEWTPAERRRVVAILRRDVEFPQTFVKAWALDSLATFSLARPRLRPIVRRHLRAFRTVGQQGARSSSAPDSAADRSLDHSVFRNAMSAALSSTDRFSP